VIESNATDVARRFSDYLTMVRSGEVVRILSNGQAVARLSADCDFLPGKDAVRIFRGVKPDPETADAIETELSKLDAEAARSEKESPRRVNMLK
jgi:antitoxin (DNA-binding transcriptional repressor) of toxin-antitoxin stability system